MSHSKTNILANEPWSLARIGMVFGLFLLYLIIIAKCSYQVLSSIIGRFYGTNLLLSSFCKVIFTVFSVLVDVQYLSNLLSNSNYVQGSHQIIFNQSLLIILICIYFYPITFFPKKAATWRFEVWLWCLYCLQWRLPNPIINGLKS